MRNVQFVTVQKQIKRRVVAMAIAACCVSNYYPSCSADDSVTSISKVDDLSRLPAVKSLGLRSNKSKISISVKAPTALDAPSTTNATAAQSNTEPTSPTSVQTAIHLPPSLPTSLPTPLPASLPGPFPGNALPAPAFPNAPLPAPSFAAPTATDNAAPAITHPTTSAVTLQETPVLSEPPAMPIVVHSANNTSSEAHFPVTAISDAQKTQVRFQAPPAMPKPQAAVGKVVMRVADAPTPPAAVTTHMPSVVVSKNGLVQTAPEIKQDAVPPAANTESRKGVRVSINGQSSNAKAPEAAPQVATSRPPELIRQSRSVPAATISEASKLSAAQTPSESATSEGVVRMKLSASPSESAERTNTVQAAAPNLPTDGVRTATKGMVDLAQVAPQRPAATPVRDVPTMERNAPSVVALPEHPPILSKPTAPAASAIAAQGATPLAFDTVVVPAGTAAAGNPGPTAPTRAAAVVDIECLNATSIPMQSTVVRIAVADEEVCKVIPSGKSLSVVANKIGRTQVSVWTADGGAKPIVVDINVVQPWHKTASKTDDIARAQNAIATMYPTAKVELRPMPDGTLDVRGQVDSEENARKVVDLVRKMFLVPVTDHVKSFR